jgi:hypothetical protein
VAVAVIGIGRVQSHYRDGLSRNEYLCHRDKAVDGWEDGDGSSIESEGEVVS